MSLFVGAPTSCSYSSEEHSELEALYDEKAHRAAMKPARWAVRQPDEICGVDRYFTSASDPQAVYGVYGCLGLWTPHIDRIVAPLSEGGCGAVEPRFLVRPPARQTHRMEPHVYLVWSGPHTDSALERCALRNSPTGITQGLLAGADSEGALAWAPAALGLAAGISFVAFFLRRWKII